MKKKIYVIKAAALILGTIILASASAQITQSSNYIHKGALIGEEPAITKENIITFEQKLPHFGSIYGYTTTIVGPMVSVPVACIVIAYSEEARIFRLRISLGAYRIGYLPIGYTYTVKAAPFSKAPLIKAVTLTADEPNVEVNFGF